MTKKYQKNIQTKIEKHSKINIKNEIIKIKNMQKMQKLKKSFFQKINFTIKIFFYTFYINKKINFSLFIN